MTMFIWRLTSIVIISWSSVYFRSSPLLGVLSTYLIKLFSLSRFDRYQQSTVSSDRQHPWQIAWKPSGRKSKCDSRRFLPTYRLEQEAQEGERVWRVIAVSRPIFWAEQRGKHFSRASNSWSGDRCTPIQKHQLYSIGSSRKDRR